MRRALLGLGIVLAGSGLTAQGQDVYNLYTGSLLTKPKPADQEWLTYGADAIVTQDPLVFVDFSTTSGGKTTLTTNDARRAGFSNYAYNPFTQVSTLVNAAFPALDRAIGFDVHVDGLKLDAEDHVTSDRAGFSIIAISSAADHKGIEVGFHANEVFSQNGPPTLFSGQGETGSVDMTQARSIDLQVTSSGYELLVDGSVVISGNLRDYSTFVPTPPLGNPYVLPSYLFFGDDTTSAGASAEFTNLAVTVPEPASLTLVVLATGLMSLRRRQPRRGDRY